MPKSTYAAVDLGSNSFHLVVARVVDGEVHVLDKLKDRVRLAAGLDADGNLDAAAQQRALDSLARFNQRLRVVSPEQLRAVGTNTLRKAHGAADFLARAEAALGHPIAIISGQEEARLVYKGVCHDLQDTGARRLVVDIGGGSTEVIVGEGVHILRADSLFMGCVGYTLRFFPDGQLTDAAFDRATVAARLELGAVKRLYRSLGWVNAYGSSGTINAVQTVLQANGWCDHCVTTEGLGRLRRAMVEAGSIDALSLPGLKPERAQVLPGGFAVLDAVLRSLHVPQMVAAQGALREGVLLELLAAAGARDVRDDTVRRLRDRYHADALQAERVERLALQLLAQVDRAWGLDDGESAQILRWGAQLREIGMAISYAGYHRHGAYLIENSDMPGFSRGDQWLLAALVLGQRRRFHIDRFRQLTGQQYPRALRLALLLRLAARLNRTRSPRPRPWIDLQVDDAAVHLTFPADWLDDRPLTRADLEGEVRYFAEVGYQLTWDAS